MRWSGVSAVTLSLGLPGRRCQVSEPWRGPFQVEEELGRRGSPVPRAPHLWRYQRSVPSCPRMGNGTSSLGGPQIYKFEQLLGSQITNSHYPIPLSTHLTAPNSTRLQNPGGRSGSSLSAFITTMLIKHVDMCASSSEPYHHLLLFTFAGRKYQQRTAELTHRTNVCIIYMLFSIHHLYVHTRIQNVSICLVAAKHYRPVLPALADALERRKWRLFQIYYRCLSPSH